MPVADHTADHAAVRAQLGRILSSAAFANSPRMSRFLKFVVESTLAGEGSRIKEYVIAIEVFDKPGTYDPQADSTVRSEASKLRSRLARHYADDGRNDPIVISIPKGSYVPVFEIRENKSAASAPGRTPWLRLTIVATVILAIVAFAILSRPRLAPQPLPKLTPLTSYPGLEEQPSLSPDGSRVAFRWKGDIYVKQVGGEEIVQVTKDEDPASWPAWSPDGSRIAFVRRGGVFLVSPVGGVARRVAESAGRIAWTPDGAGLLVLENTSPYARSIFLVNLASSEKRRLTFPDDVSTGDRDVTISPDGRTIAFCRLLHTEGCELFVAPVAGGEPRRLTNDQRFILGLAWMPDGREIVFASDRQGSFRLWRVPARPPGGQGDFETPRLLEAAGDDARYPSISGAARMAYERHARNFDIRRAEILGGEGSATHRLRPSAPLIASTRLDVTPAWSPDGNRIAFVSDRSGDREVWLSDADGSNPLMLTSFAGPAVIYPRWSPDGRRSGCNALTGPGGNIESYVVAVEGGAPRRISAPAHRSMAHPVFSHDGRWVYFIPGPQDGAVEAWRMPASGGAALQITRQGAFRPEESPDGKLLYYGKYGRSGVWSTPLEGGAERQVLTSVVGMNWTVTSHGIYFFDFGLPPDAPGQVKFYSFETGRITPLGSVERTVSNDFAGISMSPDGRWLLYSDVSSATSDLMLIDHVR